MGRAGIVLGLEVSRLARNSTDWQDGQVKVLDFGTARLKEIGVERSDTQSGVLMGTPSFMPPEQARGLWDEVDGRADLWALGATMYTLLTGHHVRSARTTNHQLFRAMTEPVPSILVARPDVSRASAAVIDRALAFDAQDRWPDADAMRVAVRDAAEAGDAAPTRNEGGHGSKPPRRSPRPRWPLVGATIVITLGLGALVHLRRPASAPAPRTAAVADPSADARSEAGASAVVQEPASLVDEVGATCVSMRSHDGPGASAKTSSRAPTRPRQTEPVGQHGLPRQRAPSTDPSPLPPSPSAASSDYLDRRY